MGEKKFVNVRVGARHVLVEIDNNTTAEDIIRMVGGDPERDVLTVNSTTRGRKDRILPLLTGRDDDVRVISRAKVGSLYFLTGEKRLRQEETLLREIGFFPSGRNRFTGPVMVGKRIVEMEVILPLTFPYARPIILVHDHSFLGRHPCIMLREEGVEIHFRDEDWKPWMHAADLVVLASDFLERVEKNRKKGRPEWGQRVIARLLGEPFMLFRER